MAGILANHVAIITGAGRGIGAETARLFAREGAALVVSDRDAGPLAAVAEDIVEEGGRVAALPGDITAPDFPAQLVAKAVEKFGKLTLLVNNAGYTWDGMCHKMGDDQFDAMLDIHLAAPFRLIRAAAPHMRDAAKQEQADSGVATARAIVNVSSVAGVRGNAGQANYSAAKAGIIGMTKSVAKEWGPFNVRCNAVAFGFVDTRLTQAKEAGERVSVGDKSVPLGIPSHMREMALMMIPMARYGTVNDAAGAILLLASPYASYITGHTLDVSGGLAM